MHHLLDRHNRERGGLEVVPCRPTWISQARDRRFGLSARGRRGAAEIQEREFELLARWFIGREALLSTAQDCRSVSGTAGEEQHAAEFDRSRRDRGRVLCLLDALGKWGDRLRVASACSRLAQLEQHRGAVSLCGRLLKRAGEQGGGPGCVP